jgi:hypothetical protein
MTFDIDIYEHVFHATVVLEGSEKILKKSMSMCLRYLNVK